MAISKKEIKELNNIIAYFTRKTFQSRSVPVTAEDVNDIVQETWRLFFEQSYHKLSKIEAKRLAVTICVREALKFFAEKNRTLFLVTPFDEEDEEIEKVPANQEEYLNREFFNFQKNWLTKAMEELPEKHAFIMKSVVSFEVNQNFSQREAIQEIGEEFQRRFKTKLTLSNYRKIKQRSIEKLQKIAKFT